MYSTPRHLSLLAASLSVVAAAHAHPGHDGHELTWDLNHLAAHPFATLGSLVVVGVTAWAVWRGARSAAHSFRGLHVKRGK